MLTVMMGERQMLRMTRLDSVPMYSSGHDFHAKQYQGACSRRPGLTRRAVVAAVVTAGVIHMAAVVLLVAPERIDLNLEKLQLHFWRHS